jgi:hypothetical protein
MQNNVATSAIMSAGMRCLKEKIGIVDTEIFISVIKETTFDDTDWRKDNLFVGMSLEDISREAAIYEKKHKQIRKTK